MLFPLSGKSFKCTGIVTVLLIGITQLARVPYQIDLNHKSKGVAKILVANDRCYCILIECGFKCE